MRRMIYTRNRQEPVVLHKGTSNGYSFAIVSFGTHPCAYVSVPKLKCLSYHLLPPVDVHGKITFSNFCPDLDDAWCFGWDYGHDGDYNGRDYLRQKINKHGKKWTTEEIMRDVERVCLQLPDVEKSVIDRFSNPEKLADELADRLMKAFTDTAEVAAAWRGLHKQMLTEMLKLK